MSTSSNNSEYQLANFNDPGVSNVDVDWLFRGREVKKLTKKSNSISNEVQSQLLKAQQLKKDLQSENFDENYLNNSMPQNIPISSPATELPLKSSLKTKFSNPISNSFPNSDNHHKNSSVSSSVSSTLSLNSNLNFNSFSNISSNSNSTPQPQSQPLLKSQSQQNSPVNHLNDTAKPRSSSLTKSFTRTRSPSDIAKSTKKSLFSSLSAKFKSANPPLQNIVTATTTNLPPSTSTSSNSSVNLKRNVSVKRNISSSSLTPSPPLSVTPTTPKNISPSNPKFSKINSIPFKRVNFRLNDLVDDPQQQIPSRRPKKGNVLIPEDLLASPPKLSIGITNSFNEQTKDEKPSIDKDLLEKALLRQKFFLVESKKHSDEAYIAALRIEKEVKSFRARKLSNSIDDDDDFDDDEYDEDEEIRQETYFSPLKNLDESLDIDTPIHEHINYFGDDSAKIDDKGNLNKEISLELLYTRCCHLREILPIPATLKQLKNKSKPLHVLKMLNPKPTLIDILSFSDFLSITPIITVIFDNVLINSEMLKIILISLQHSKTLEKLSLRNVTIDSTGWEYLCKFLLLNKNVKKLDISQQQKNSNIVTRSDSDWNLLIDSLILRNGLEELILNGSCLKDFEFHKLINDALRLKTKRLGLASTQLSVEKSKLLANWISKENNNCIGIDIAFNDLSNGQLSPFNKIFKNNYNFINLMFFSLNSTNINLNDAIEVIKNLKNLKNLKFLDLGNNKELFPKIISTLRDYLPKFPELRRIHFDCNELKEIDLVQISLIIQQCPKLVHVSFLGNKNIDSKSSVAMYSAIKNSNIYNLDLDYSLIDKELSSKMTFYLMKNMENFLNNSSSTEDKNSSSSVLEGNKFANLNLDDEDLIFDGSLLTQAAENLLESKNMINNEEKIILFSSVIEKTIKLRNEIQIKINKLFNERKSNKLSIETKENLLRFCLLDNSLENILKIFEKKVNEYKRIKSSLISNSNSNSNSTISDEIDPFNTKSVNPALPTNNINDQLNSLDYPHFVVSDSINGPVDDTTGKPVYIRSFSQTSIHSKKLEEEEGEFHRWGFFVQQQNDIMPDDSQINKEGDVEEQKEKEIEKFKLIKAEELRRINEQNKKLKLKINPIPSGADLRETIIKAKGIESISDLIKKVNKDFSTVEKIYKHANVDVDHNKHKDDLLITGDNENTKENQLSSSPVSINSMDGLNRYEEADEAYEKILDDVIKIRSNK